MHPHLHHPHEEAHLKSAHFLRDIVIGMSDGLTVPFALAAGLSGAAPDSRIIVIAGMAAIGVGSTAMGLARYLSGKTEQEQYQTEVKREYEDVENLRKVGIGGTKAFFANIGLSESLQDHATAEITQDKNRWVNFTRKYELDLDKPDPKRARKSALNIGFSYAIGGVIPLSPYFFISNAAEALNISAVAGLFCLFVFGYFKSNITGINAWKGAMQAALIGALAAAAAFGVATLFE